MRTPGARLDMNESMMVMMTAFEVSRSFASVLDQVERGATIVVTRGGKRLATIAPAATANGTALADFLADRLGAMDESFAEDVLGSRDLPILDDPWGTQPNAAS